MSEREPLELRLTARMRPAVIARRTIEAYEAGRDVVWLTMRSSSGQVEKAAAALGDWRAAYGTSMSLPGESRTAVMFAHSDEGRTMMTYWRRST